MNIKKVESWVLAFLGVFFFSLTRMLFPRLYPVLYGMVGVSKEMT